MIRLAARRLWTRRLQALAPLVALLAATLGFQAVLVSARSTQSHVQGVIAANWNPPYDLLVHPASLVTGLQPGDRLAQPNFLDSVGGGINLEQVATVWATSGVAVAAPLGVVATDYLQGFDYAIDVSTLPHPNDFNLYRVTTTMTTDGGLSTIPTYTRRCSRGQPTLRAAPQPCVRRGVATDQGTPSWVRCGPGSVSDNACPDTPKRIRALLQQSQRGSESISLPRWVDDPDCRRRSCR